jgi:hypothetical protein
MTGLTTVEHKPSKLISVKEKKQVPELFSAEGVTLMTCMSAPALYVSPLIAFRRKNAKEELLDGTSQGRQHPTIPQVRFKPTFSSVDLSLH